MREPQRAPHGHETINSTPISWQIHDENQSRNALITSINNPTVRMMKAQDRNLRMGRIKMLTNPITAAMTANASQADVPWTDIKLYGAKMKYAITKATIVMSQWMKNFIGYPFLANWQIWIE
jgi:hypothetical protein